ncbi:MAG: hypothetical protein AAF517_00460 [Planctomycetota bacterium]
MIKYFRSWWGWTLLVLFVSVIGTVAWLRYDVSPPEDSDLVVPRVSVPKSENGFYVWGVDDDESPIRTPYDALDDGEDVPFTLADVEAADLHDIAFGRAWSESIVTWVVEENRDALLTLRKVLEYRYHRIPDSARSAWCFRLGPIALLMAHREARAENWGEAFRWCENVREFGVKLRTGNGVLGVLTGLPLEQIYGLGGLLTMLQMYDVPRDVLDRVTRGFPRQSSLMDSVRSALLSSYTESRRLIHDTSEMRDLTFVGDPFSEVVPGWWEVYGFRPNETLFELAARTREAVRAIEGREGLNPFRFSAASRLSVANRLGRRIVDHWFFGKAVLTMYYDSEARYRLTAVYLAAERFRRDRNRLPRRLIELVPSYLDAVPQDPYSKNPLRLRADGVVYSVGENREDGGGRERRSIVRERRFRKWEKDGENVAILLEDEDYDRINDPRRDGVISHRDGDLSLELFVPDDRLVDYGLISDERSLAAFRAAYPRRPVAQSPRAAETRGSFRRSTR